MEAIPVFFNTQDVAEVKPDWYETLKHNARLATMKRSRLCLHRGADDPLHEMVIVFHRDGVIRPHRHLTKSESFHVIFGELDILMFDDAGRPAQLVRMGDLASGKTLIYRLGRPIWHSVIVRTEFAAIHEVTNGPFRAEESEFAPWSPEEPAALRAFLDQSLDALACKA